MASTDPRCQQRKGAGFTTQRSAGDGWRTVTKAYGLRIENYDYLAPELGRFIGERVRVLYDPEGDMGRVFAFDAKGQFIAVAECPELTGLDRQQVAAHAKAIQRQTLQEQVQAIRAEAKQTNTKRAAEHILDLRAADAKKLKLLPQRKEEHASGGLNGALQALQTQRPRDAKIVPQEKLEQLRAEMTQEEERAQAGDRPDFASPYHRVHWTLEQILRGRLALTQIVSEDRAFARNYLKNTVDHKALDYLGDIYARYWEVKSDLAREEESAEPSELNEKAAG